MKKILLALVFTTFFACLCGELVLDCIGCEYDDVYRYGVSDLFTGGGYGLDYCADGYSVAECPVAAAIRG